MTEHESYRFSVTVASDDLAVIGCLRALAQYSQKTGNNRIPWGGTKDDDWRRAGIRITLRFDSRTYRDGFLNEAERLLGANWTKVAKSDDDPARHQRR